MGELAEIKIPMALGEPTNRLASRLRDKGYSIKFTLNSKDEVVGWELVGGENPVTAKTYLRQGMLVDDIVSGLSDLWLSTQRRGVTQGSMEQIVLIYAKELSQWPAMAVREMLTEYPKRNKWWPTLSELVEALTVAEFGLVRDLKLAIEKKEEAENCRDITGDLIIHCPKQLADSFTKWFQAGNGARAIIVNDYLRIETDNAGRVMIPKLFSGYLKSQCQKRGLSKFVMAEFAA